VSARREFENFRAALDAARKHGREHGTTGRPLDGDWYVFSGWEHRAAYAYGWHQGRELWDAQVQRLAEAAGVSATTATDALRSEQDDPTSGASWVASNVQPMADPYKAARRP
jgi:hypothetical protein